MGDLETAGARDSLVELHGAWPWSPGTAQHREIRYVGASPPPTENYERKMPEAGQPMRAIGDAGMHAWKNRRMQRRMLKKLS